MLSLASASTVQSAPVIAALIAATAALIGLVVNGFVTWRMSHRQKALEAFKADLQSTLSGRQALISYRFDARRRLYTECEPIFFQLREAAHDALRLMPRFCEKDFQAALGGPQRNSVGSGRWMLNDSSTTIYTLYCLLRPLALYCLLKRKVTDVDLSLDATVLFRYRLAQEIYYCLYSDSEIARASPPIEYDPLVPNWRELRETCPARYWWQGASPGRLENGVSCLIAGDRILSFGEFEDLYSAAYNDTASVNQKRIGVVANALYNFNPQDRPVFWRILVIKTHLYAALIKAVPEDIEAILQSSDRLREFLRLPAEVSQCFNHVAETIATEPRLADDAFGLRYLVTRLQTVSG